MNDRRIQIRVNDAQYEALQTAADELARRLGIGASMSDVFRYVMTECLGEKLGVDFPAFTDHRQAGT